jgi:hypothetical protein
VKHSPAGASASFVLDVAVNHYGCHMHLTVGTFGEFTPFVFSIPPYFTEDGDRSEPSIIIHLTGEQHGPQQPNSRISLTIEEAEVLIENLSDVVAKGKESKFSDLGYAAAQEPNVDGVAD